MRTRVLARRVVVLVMRAAAWALARLQDPDDEEEGDLPVGHPVVTQGPEARRMVDEGRPSPRAREEESPPEPLKGSVRERMVRARRGAGRG